MQGNTALKSLLTYNLELRDAAKSSKKLTEIGVACISLSFLFQILALAIG